MLYKQSCPPHIHTLEFDLTTGLETIKDKLYHLIFFFFIFYDFSI